MKYYAHYYREKIRSDGDKIRSAKKEFVNYQKECLKNIKTNKLKWKNSILIKNKEKYKSSDEFILNIQGKAQIKVNRGLLTKVRINNIKNY